MTAATTAAAPGRTALRSAPGGSRPRLVRQVLVRHGECLANVEHRPRGQSDTALTPRGRDQAEREGGGNAEQVFRYAPGLVPVSLDIHQYPAEEAVQTATQQVLEPLVALEDGERRSPRPR